MNSKTTGRLALVSIAALTLAACGGSSGGGDDDDFVISSGLLELEIPTEDVPASLQDFVDDIQTTNETGTVDTALTGSATYDGSFAFGIDNSDAIVSGDAEIVTNIGATTATATFDNASVDEGGGPSALTGSFATGAMTITGGYYSGAFTGTLTQGIDGTLNGVFADGGAVDTIGTLQGTVTNPDTTTDGLDGFFSDTETP